MVMLATIFIVGAVHETATVGRQQVWRRRSMPRSLVDILLETIVATAVIVIVLYVLFGPPAYMSEPVFNPDRKVPTGANGSSKGINDRTGSMPLGASSKSQLPRAFLALAFR
jgi:hypothetical protein